VSSFVRRKKEEGRRKKEEGRRKALRTDIKSGGK
jgi:hypothetical protein